MCGTYNHLHSSLDGFLTENTVDPRDMFNPFTF